MPSTGTKKRFMEEANVLAKLHVVGEMGKGDTGYTGNCLHGDGTTKHHCVYENYQVTTKSGRTMSLGLLEVVNTDAESLLTSFKNVMGDLGCVMDGEDKEKDNTQLVTSFSNTMSDLAPINPLFHHNLKSCRQTLLK